MCALKKRIKELEEKSEFLKKFARNFGVRNKRGWLTLQTYYGNYGYVATVSKICSDSRAGMNLSSTIDKLMF